MIANYLKKGFYGKHTTKHLHTHPSIFHFSMHSHILFSPKHTQLSFCEGSTVLNLLYCMACMKVNESAIAEE